MAERIQHPYQCQNMGCPNGHSSTFFGAPPEHWAAKGMSEPKSCQACREWKKALTDSNYRCRSCSGPIRQTAGAKLMHHKLVGPYEPPKECQNCQGEEKVSKNIVPPSNPLPRLPAGQGAQVLNIVSFDDLSSERHVHYGRHIDGHPFSEVGQLRPAGDLVSRTTLVEPGATTYGFYYAGREVAGQTVGVYQYRTPNRNVLKVNVVNSTHVELTVFKPTSDGPYELLTSYDEVPIAEVIAKVSTGSWT